MTVTRTESGWQVLWQERALLTPRGVPVIVPTEALAQAVAAEWAVVKKVPQASQIPLSQYVNTTLDHIRSARDGALEGWLSHARSDLLCHRADQPPELIKRQQTVWQPLLDWAERDTGARLVVGVGVMPIPQPPDALDALRRAAEQLDDFRLMALAQSAGLLGSAVLALALVRGYIPTTTALAASLLDELHQSERWGEPEELTRRRDDLTAELETLARFLALLT